MENNIVDYVSQLHVRNAAKKFYSISKEHSQDESINLIFSGMVSFLEGIKIPEPEILDKYEVKRSLTIEDIEREVCEYYRIDPEKIHQRCRKRHFAQCRFMICYFAYKYKLGGVLEIGRFFDIDYTSVVYAKKKIKDLADVEEKTRLDIENIKYNIHEFLKDS